MVRQIPFHAIESPTGPTFRGPWRTYGQIVAYLDFTDGVIPAAVVTSSTGGVSVTSPSLVDLALTPATGRPIAPGAKALAATPSRVAGTLASHTARLGIRLQSLPLPAGVEVTRIEFSHYMANGTNRWRSRWYADGTTGPEINWAESWFTAAFTAGITNVSEVGIEAVPYTSPSFADAGAPIGITGVTVYGTSVADYRMGDTVSYLGKLWQSLTDNNNDEPGTTLRWIDLGSLQSPNTSLYTVTERFVAANNGTNTFALGAHPSTVLNVHWAGLSQPAAHWDVTNTTLTLHDTEGYVKSGDPVSITYSLTQT